MASTQLNQEEIKTIKKIHPQLKKVLEQEKNNEARLDRPMQEGEKVKIQLNYQLPMQQTSIAVYCGSWYIPHCNCSQVKIKGKLHEKCCNCGHKTLLSQPKRKEK